MKETISIKSHLKNTIRTVLGITLLTLLILVSIAGAEPIAYVATTSGNGVAVIDTATNTVSSYVNVPGDNPTDIISSPDGKKVVVRSYGSRTSVIDTTTNTVTTDLSDDSEGDFVYSPDGKKLYMTYNSGVSVFDAVTNKIITNITYVNDSDMDFGNLFQIAVTSDGSKLYIVSPQKIRTVDTATYKTISLIPNNFALKFVPNPNGKTWYSVKLGSSSNISVYDIAANEVKANISLQAPIDSYAFSQDGSKLYVGLVGSYSLDSKPKISVIDTVTNRVINTVPASNNLDDSPQILAVSPDGKKVYVSIVTPNGANGISVFDTETNTFTATIPVISVTNRPHVMAFSNISKQNTKPVNENIQSSTVSTTEKSTNTTDANTQNSPRSTPGEFYYLIFASMIVLYIRKKLT
jgi:YVTN family beta-propeller protein